MTSYSLKPPLPTAPDEWVCRREALRREWLVLLGGFPLAADLKPVVLGRWKEVDHTRYLVAWQSEPEVWTDAFLLIPQKRNQSGDRVPAAVVFHATSSRHILQPVGLADAPTRHLALYLTRRGFVTLSPRCYIYGPPSLRADAYPETPERGAADFKREARELMQRAPRWSGMGRMLWDALRAVDYLAARPEIDPERIACVGHSLGAKQVLYSIAFDDRIRAGVFSEGGVGLRHSNWDAPWYLGSQVVELKPERDHHELLALAAPRPLLMCGGGEADGEHTRPLVQGALPVYKLCGAADSLRLHVHEHGHDIPEAVREQAFDWLEAVIRE